jgi:hypothetical protein
VHEHVDAAVLVAHVRRGGPHGGLVGEVARDVGAVGAVEDDRAMAGGPQRCDDRAADGAGAAGDERAAVGVHGRTILT